jgi:membrane protein implicated in regulation of membrane protease activity
MFSLPGHVLFWIVALVIFLVVEAVSAGLVSIWFAAGALAALICAALKGPLWLQALWFVVVSGVTLILPRPLGKEYVNGKSVATNADRNIGRSAVVTEKVDNLAGVGTVKLDGVLWSARSVNDAPIEEGTTVVVREIRGVKLLVEPESGE